jgi:DNA-binding transcriptional MocR family regulator
MQVHGRDGGAHAAGISLTHEVMAAIRGRIATGQLRTGERLPSERVLAAQLKVSRVTVVRALARLRIEGLVSPGTAPAAMSPRPTDCLTLSPRSRPARRSR